jgi:hypothetical protein
VHTTPVLVILETEHHAISIRCRSTDTFVHRSCKFIAVAAGKNEAVAVMIQSSAAEKLKDLRQQKDFVQIEVQMMPRFLHRTSLLSDDILGYRVVEHGS